MRNLTIKTAFSYWHRGTQRVDYVPAQEVETDDDEFAGVAVAEGWAEPSDAAGAAKHPRSKKAHAGAPENKAAE